MDEVYIILGIIFAVLLVFIVMRKVLSVYIRRPLVEFFNKRGFSASPWLMLLPIAGGFYLLEEHSENMFSEKMMGGVISNYSYSDSMSRYINEYGGIALIVLPILILLIRTRKYFIPVLLIKIVCIPLDISYLLTGEHRNGDATPISRSAYINGVANIYCDNYYSEDAEETHGSTVEEKYADQYRASKSADLYHTAQTDAGEMSYSSDYVPFISAGEVGNIQTYDSDYTKMD